jgi:hypothetical protein
LEGVKKVFRRGREGAVFGKKGSRIPEGWKPLAGD